MAADPRMALSKFTGALERHFEAVSQRRGAEDPNVESAYEQLLEAFLDYEEALGDKFDEYLPFVQEDFDE
ncbi:MAG: hypothetical protein RLZ88_846 [Actinomycetota bacterium]|jgi:hypothetical protein